MSAPLTKEKITKDLDMARLDEHEWWPPSMVIPYLELALWALKAKEALKDTLEHLDWAETRFTAMSLSTIENGRPSAQELIAMTNASAMKLGMSVAAAKPILADFPKTMDEKNDDTAPPHAL